MENQRRFKKNRKQPNESKENQRQQTKIEKKTKINEK